MPAVSKAQQRFMGMVHAVKKGEMAAPSPEVAQAASSMNKKDAKDFASTKHKGLPEKKKVEEKLDLTSPKEVRKRRESEQRNREQDLRMKHGKKWKEFTQDVERVRSRGKGIRGTHKGKWGTFNKGVFTPDN